MRNRIQRWSCILFVCLGLVTPLSAMEPTDQGYRSTHIIEQLRDVVVGSLQAIWVSLVGPEMEPIGKPEAPASREDPTSIPFDELVSQDDGIPQEEGGPGMEPVG